MAVRGSGPDARGPPGQYFVARLRGKDVAGIGSRPAGATPPPPAWHTHVSVASADLTAEKAVSAGGSIVAAPLDAPPAGRMAVLADPTGAVFSVWQPGLRHGAQLVNEPSAWSMSRLDTSDPTRAAAFYAELFGSTTETFDLGDSSITLFRLPGYVGGEPQQPVSREVVAIMSPIDPDRSAHDAPSHWSGDFWVEGVDAATERAGQVGGSVVAPPFDIPIGRTAVLADLAGAVFSVSQVGPRR